jgi:hypothetical protein
VGGSGVLVSGGGGGEVFVSVGCSVAVGGTGVSVSVGSDVKVGTAVVGIGVAVLVLVGCSVDVAASVGVRLGSGSRVFVGGKIKESKEKGVGLGVADGPETGIRTKLNVRVGTAVMTTSVEGRTISVGAKSDSICTASAAAVLFMLTSDTSALLRSLISIAVGGFGLNPAITTIIHAMPTQRNTAMNACSGTT